MLDYTLIRSDRKTLGIEIDRSGQLLVRAPKRMRIEDIERYLQAKQSWIAEKQALMCARQQKVSATDTNLWLFGKQYQISYADVKTPMLKGETIVAPIGWTTEKQIIWLKAMLRKYLNDRLPYWAAKTGLHPSGCHMTGARGRWGSCSGKKSVNFAWRLVFCPTEVIDYVVIHELCHIRHMNHSAAFWSLVAQYDPAYTAHRQWLREHAPLMDLFT